MNRLLILEGIDCVGKTTRIKEHEKYEKDYGLKVNTVHMSGSDPNTTEFYQTVFKEKGSHCNVLIMDRSMIGELVYGPRYRGHSRINMVDTAQLLHNAAPVTDVELLVVLEPHVYAKVQKIRAERDDLVPDNLLNMFEDQLNFLNVCKELNVYNKVNVRILETKFSVCVDKRTFARQEDVTFEDAIERTKRILENIKRGVNYYE